jgi:hypothetical protein
MKRTKIGFTKFLESNLSISIYITLIELKLVEMLESDKNQKILVEIYFSVPIF